MSTKGKELGWRAVDKLRRVRKHPTYLLRFLPSRTKRRLGTQRYQHALICLVNAYVCKPTPVQAHPSALILLQQEVLWQLLSLPLLVPV